MLPNILDPHLKVVLSLNKIMIPPMLQVQVSHTVQRTCTCIYYNVLLIPMVFSINSPTLVSIQCEKVIVSMPQLLQLVPSACLHPSCASKLSLDSV